MGRFRYEAVDKSGRVVRGVMDASDQQMLAQKLTGMGYSLRAVHTPSQAAQPSVSQSQAVAAPQPRAATTSGIQAVTLPNGVPVSIKSAVAASSLAVFFRQLATLVRSGRPLYQSSTDIYTRDGKLKNALQTIQQYTQGGKKLSGAMAEYPGVFPVHTIASVWSGELAGKLDTTLDEVASDFEQEASELRYGRIGWFITKLTVISAIFVGPMCFVGPILTRTLQNTLDAKDPKSSDVYRFFFTNYVNLYFWKSFWVAIGVILAWIGFGFIKRVPVVKRLIDGVVIRVPVWGKLHRYRALARFTHVLDGLMAAGLAPSSAWDAASLTPRNSAVAEKLRLAKSAPTATPGVAGMLAASGIFDPEDVALISAGEKSGQVPEALGRLSSVYADKASSQRTVARAVSVNLLVTMCLVAGIYLFYVVESSWLKFEFDAADMITK